jgi:hypothetical protein
MPKLRVHTLRYYVGSCEYKWTHARTQMEQMWVAREVGLDLFKTAEQNDWEWTLVRSNSQALPGDVYCRCDVYLEVPHTPAGTHFVLKYPQLKPVERTTQQ